MEIFQGTEGFGSIAIAKIRVLNKSDNTESEKYDRDAEIKKYETARKRTVELLESSQENENNKSLLMLVSDHQLEDAIIARIYNQGAIVSQAISSAGEYLEDVLKSQKDPYLKSKGTDIKALTRMLLSCLDDYDGADAYFPDDCIIATKNLSSADFLKLDKEKVAGLIVERASSTSHMAILAKAMSIPTILGMEVDSSMDGRDAVLDGGWRALYVDPDDATLSDMRARLEEESQADKKLQELKGKKSVTSDGRTIDIFANISSHGDISAVERNDAEGIGLFRTETFYVNRNYAPTEDELFEEFKIVAQSMANKPVCIRTVDLGQEKTIPYLGNKVEVNSALGCRGIRLCFKYEDLFKTQIKAILRAAVYGNISMMFPMITSVREFLQAKDIVNECYHELSLKDVPYKEVQVGVMIETPAAVLIADELARYADFFSIGTNDLIQYTLGADRDNKDLASVIDYHHPAVLKMIRMTVQSAHRNDIPVGICGELASDDKMTAFFLDEGVDMLSISPSRILRLRDQIIRL